MSKLLYLSSGLCTFMPSHLNRILILVLLALLCAASSAQAAVRSWNGNVSSDWFTAGNWEPAGIPAVNDTVNLANGGRINLPRDASVGEFNLSNGILEGAGTLTVMLKGSWTAGDISGQIAVGANATFTLSGTQAKRLSGGRIRNSGNIQWAGSGEILGYSGASITNTGVFEAVSDARFSFCCSHPVATFYNEPSGVVRKKDSAGQTLFGEFLLNNRGTLDIQTGTLLLASEEHRLQDGGRVRGSGQVQITSSTQVKGTTTIEAGGTLVFASGTIKEEGVLSGAGTFEWLAGEVRGTLTIGEQLKFLISGDATKNVPGGVIHQKGRATWSGKGNLMLYAGARFNNSGTFDVQGDADAVFCCSHPEGQFNNSGQFIKSSGSETNGFSDVVFNNTGILAVRTGVIALGLGGTSSGVFSNAPNARIDFAGGTHIIGKGARFVGAGTTRITAGTVQLDAASEIAAEATLELHRGNITGTGTFNGEGTFLWSGGRLSGELVLGKSAKARLTSEVDKQLGGGKFHNQGTVLWEGTGPIIGFSGGAITNSGLFEIQNDSPLNFCCSHPLAVFFNEPSGTVRKTKATGETVFADLVLENRGRVDVQTGSIVLAGPNHQIRAGGKFSGGGRVRTITPVTLEGISAIEEGGTFELATGGEFNGTGGFSGKGTLEWTGGKIRAAMSTGVETRLNIAGADRKEITSGIITNQGTAVWTGDGRITGIAGSQFYNKGLFEARNDGLADFCCSHPFSTFHNQAGGVFRKLESNGNTTFSEFHFNNNGRVEVLTGRLVLAAGGVSTGTFTNAPGGAIDFTGGTMVLENGGNITVGGGNRITRGATVTLNGNHNIAEGGTFELAGGVLNGVGVIGGKGTFLWTSGELRGELTVAKGGTMRLSGADPKHIPGGSLRNEGTVVWSGDGNLVSYMGGRISNAGLFDMQNDSAFSFCCAHPIGSFINESEGTLRKSSSAGESVFSDQYFVNRGTVDIQTGVLAFRGSDHRFEHGGKFRGAGRTLIATSIVVDGTSRIEEGGTLVLASGRVTGTATFEGPGTFVWSGGDLRADLSIAQGTTMSIEGDGRKALAEGILRNGGRTIWTGAGTITGISGGRIFNTGIFELKNDAAFDFCCAHPVGIFYNEPGGLLRKTSKGISGFYDFGFVNNGRLSIQGGSLRLPDGSFIEGVCPVKVPAAVGIDLLPSNTEARISWSHGGLEDGGDNLSFSGFEIEKSANGGPFEKIASVPPGVFQYVVPESCDGPVNTYRVRGLSDGCNSGYSASVTIPRPTVPPEFTSKPQDLAAAEKLFVYDANAIDKEGSKVVYILVNGPQGMTIDPLTGVVQWTPPSSLRGQFIPVSIGAFNGSCGAKAIQTFELAIGETPPPGGFKIRIGKLELSADSLFRLNAPVGLRGLVSRQDGTDLHNLEDGTFKLGGDVKINDYMRFDGSVVVTLNRAAATIDVKVDQGKVYVTNIPLVGNKTLWEGGKIEFTVDGNGEVTRLLQEQLARPLQAAGVDVDIERARLLLEDDLGIRIFGKLKFPDVYGVTALSGEFDALEISQRNGIRFQGKIRLADIELGGIGVRNIELEWLPQNDPSLDVFEGEGQLITPGLEVAARVRVAGGGLDGIYANLNFPGVGIPVPPAAPFFNITGGGLGVEGLRAGPFSIEGDINLTLLHPELRRVISLDQLGLKYTAPSAFKMKGNLHILSAKAAKAYLNLDLPYRFELGGDVQLIEQFPVLIISADLTAGVNPDPLRFFLEGGASGKLQIPPYDNFPGAVKNLFPPLVLAKPFLPKTLAEASVAYRNGMFSSSIGLPVIGDIVFAVRNAQGQIQFLVGRNLSNLTKIIGLSDLHADGTIAEPVYQKTMLKSLRRDQDSMGGGHLEGHGLYIPLVKHSAPLKVASVQVPAGAPRVIFRLFGEQAAPRYQLVKPDGSRLTATATGGAHYEEIAGSKETYFVVTAPAAGQWDIVAEDASQGPFVLDAWGANAAPVIASIAANQAGSEVAVSYNASDLDDQVSVSLFYDTDQAGFDGMLIATNLPAGETGSYVWNTAAANLPSGNYYVYAVVDDDKNLPAQRYAAARISVIDPLAPASPKNVKVQAVENSLLVTWEAGAEPHIRGYEIRYGEDLGNATSLSEVVNAGRTNQVQIKRLENETSYRLVVLAYSQVEQGQAGAQAGPSIHYSLPSDVAMATTASGKAPAVKITSPNGGEQLAQNSSIMVSWKLEGAEDVVDQQVDLSTDGGQTWRPLSKHLDASKRNMTWDIPTGLQSSRARIRVSVLDKAGNEGVDVSDASFVVSGSDSDGDGLPDAFESANGFNPAEKGEELLDSDSDGLTNFQEYLAGTNPRDAASALRVSAAALDASGVEIRFATINGKQYRVERTDSLGSGVWTVIGGEVAGDGSVRQVSDLVNGSTSARFYRVVLVN